MAMATVDGVQRIALVALARDGRRERIVGDCRLMGRPGPGRSAEAAIAVSEDYRRVGLGTALLTLLFAAGTNAGFELVVAEVRYDNDVMMRLLRRLGFQRTAWELGVGTFTRSLVADRQSRSAAGERVLRPWPEARAAPMLRAR